MSNEMYSYYPYTPIPTPHRPKEMGGVSEERVKEIVNDKVNGITDEIVDGDREVKSFSIDLMGQHEIKNMLHGELGHGIATALPTGANLRDYEPIYQHATTNHLYSKNGSTSGVITVKPSGDTTGNTDRNNLNDAITKCSTAGGVIQLEDGDFYINGNAGQKADIFQLPASTTIIGRGLGTVLHIVVSNPSLTNNYRAVFGINTPNCKISDLTVIGEWDETIAHARTGYDYFNAYVGYTEPEEYLNGISNGAFVEFGAELEADTGLFAEVSHCRIEKFPTSAFMQWKCGKHVNVYLNYIYHSAGIFHGWKNASGFYFKDNLSFHTIWGVLGRYNYEQVFTGNKFYNIGNILFKGDSSGAKDARINIGYSMGDWLSNSLLPYDCPAFGLIQCHYYQVLNHITASSFGGRTIDYNGYGNYFDETWYLGNVDTETYLSFNATKTFPAVVVDNGQGTYVKLNSVNTKETVWMCEGGLCVQVYLNCYLTNVYEGTAKMASTPYRGGTFKDSGYFTPRTGWTTLTTN